MNAAGASLALGADAGVRTWSSAIVSQTALDDAILSALAALAAELGAGQPQSDGRGGFRIAAGGVSLGLHGSPRTQEIEWWVDAPGAEYPHIRAEVIQEWAGEPIRAYQFNDSNFRDIAATVVRSARPVLAALREDQGGTLRALAAADERIDARSRLARIRGEANDAWGRRDYIVADKLYASIADALTPSEAKRLEIARREAG